MPLSESELSRIAEIVSGEVKSKLDAKALRQVIDSVVDQLAAEQNNDSNNVTGPTCDTSSKKTPGAESTPLPERVENITTDGGLYERIDQSTGDRVILAAFGHNRPGVIAALTQVLAENMCNLEDVSQKIMREFFTMIMIVDISNCPTDFQTLVEKVKATERQLGMKVYMMREDTFQYMHRI